MLTAIAHIELTLSSQLPTIAHIELTFAHIELTILGLVMLWSDFVSHEYRFATAHPLATAPSTATQALT